MQSLVRLLGMGVLQRTCKGNKEQAVDSRGLAPLMHAFSIDDSPWSRVDIAGTIKEIAGLNGGT